MKKNGGGAIYYSFDEIGQALFGLKPQRRVTRDKQKLASQRERFLGTCPHCGKPLYYVYGTNVLTCDNPDCKGKKVVTKDAEGNETVVYKPYFKVLQRENSTEIGMTLFGNESKGENRHE